MPKFIAPSVDMVDFGYLKRLGVRAVLIDLDGTVVARRQYRVGPDIRRKLKDQPLPLYIATNRPKSRGLRDLELQLNARGAVHPHGLAGKPFASYYRRAARQLKLRPHQLAMIGDRYIQDIIGANLAGLQTVLVHKLDKPVNWLDAWLSGSEKWLTKRLKRRYRPSAGYIICRRRARR